jgi:hypothetical protein
LRSDLLPQARSQKKPFDATWEWPVIETRHSSALSKHRQSGARRIARQGGDGGARFRLALDSGDGPCGASTQSAIWTALASSTPPLSSSTLEADMKDRQTFGAGLLDLRDFIA